MADQSSITWGAFWTLLIILWLLAGWVYVVQKKRGRR